MKTRSKLGKFSYSKNMTYSVAFYCIFMKCEIDTNNYLSLASGYSVKASQRSSLDKENKSEYPTLLTLAVLRLPVLFPGIFKMLTSPNTAPSARVT